GNDWASPGRVQRTRVLRPASPVPPPRLDRLEHLSNGYSSAAVALLKSVEKVAALDRVKRRSRQWPGSTSRSGPSVASRSIFFSRFFLRTLMLDRNDLTGAGVDLNLLDAL